jgi:hypothetical protein
MTKSVESKVVQLHPKAPSRWLDGAIAFAFYTGVAVRLVLLAGGLMFWLMVIAWVYA